MRIGIDATEIGVAGGSRGGVYHYVLQLLRNLARCGPEHEYQLLFGLPRPRHRATIRSALEALGPGLFRARRAPVPMRWLHRSGLPVEVFVGSVDVFHGPSHLTPSLGCGPSVVTVHDLSYLLDRAGAGPPAELDAAGRRGWNLRRRFFAQLEQGMERSLERASLVIAVSQHTARSIVQQFRIDPAKIRITHLAARPELIPPEESGAPEGLLRFHRLPRDYGLFVGTLDPNKNLAVLLEAFARFRRRGGSAALVLAGDPGWYGPVLQELAMRHGIGPSVHLLGRVSDGELGALYSRSRFTVVPSALEGFGIPTLEAMRCGAPVIAARRGALPEVAGNAALFVDPDDPAAFCDAMLELEGDPGLRLSMVRAGAERADQFSWKETARQTLAVYREACALAQSQAARTPAFEGAP